MPNYPNYTIRQAAFNPTIFQGIDFNPQQADMSLLANSFARMEERERTAADKLSGLQATFAKLRESVINTPEMNEWLDKYSRNIVNEVQSFARHGDYSGAITAATNFAGQVLNDPSLQGRIKFSAQVRQEDDTLKQRVARGEISQNKYRWYKATRNIDYEDNFDDEGNIIGGTDYEPMTIYNDPDMLQITKLVFDNIRPYKYSEQDSVSRSYDNQSEQPFSVNDNVTGEHTQSGLSGYSYKTGSGRSEERVTVKEIMDGIEHLIRTNSDLMQSLLQQYEVDSWVYMQDVNKRNELLEEYNKLNYKKSTGNWTEEDEKQLLDVSNEFNKYDDKKDYQQQLLFTGGDTGFYLWLAQKVNNQLFAENLAYDWKTFTSEDVQNYSKYKLPSSGGGGARTIGNVNSRSHANAQGTNTRQTVDYTNSDNAAQSAGDAAVTIYTEE